MVSIQVVKMLFDEFNDTNITYPLYEAPLLAPVILTESIKNRDFLSQRAIDAFHYLVDMHACRRT